MLIIQGFILDRNAGNSLIFFFLIVSSAIFWNISKIFFKRHTWYRASAITVEGILSIVIFLGEIFHRGGFPSPFFEGIIL